MEINAYPAKRLIAMFFVQEYAEAIRKLELPSDIVVLARGGSELSICGVWVNIPDEMTSHINDIIMPQH